jgi:hypothetical protein
VAVSNTCQTTCDVSRGIGDRDFEMTKSLDIESLEIPEGSGPSIWRIGGRRTGRTSGYRESEDRESRRHEHGDIENVETLMRGLTEVMC